tara:strand:- start:3568 stop:4584 length:1017 start_codon:yes stop_codon:yes gene_type:complete
MNYIDKINNENSYILGSLLLRAYIYENKIESIFYYNECPNKNVIEKFKLLGEVEKDEFNSTKVIIENEKILEKIKEYFDTDDLKYPNYVKFIEENIESLGFIKSLFEFNGCIVKNLDMTTISYIPHKNSNLIETIKNKINIPCEIITKEMRTNIIKYENVNCIDFLAKLYNENENICNDEYYNKYYEVINNNNNNKLPKLKVYKENNEAILPSKSRESDAGYDITIIKEIKNLTKKTKIYDTGIKLDIPNGYYVAIYPRSSISKSGYMLANSVGIIDQGYRGNILIALTKIDMDSEDLKLPFKCCQMILKKQNYCILEETKEDLNKTTRNEGGFGSTN